MTTIHVDPRSPLGRYMLLAAGWELDEEQEPLGEVEMRVEDEPITHLTPQQRHALEVLQEGSGTTRQTAEAMLSGHPSMTYDRAHALLARLEKRGLVQRASAGRAVWSITTSGIEALA